MQHILQEQYIYIYSPSTFLQPYLLRRQDIGNCFTVVWTLPGINTRAKRSNPVHDITSGRHSSSNFLHPRSVKFRWDVNDTLNLTFVIYIFFLFFFTCETLKKMKPIHFISCILGVNAVKWFFFLNTWRAGGIMAVRLIRGDESEKWLFNTVWVKGSEVRFHLQEWFSKVISGWAL